MRLTKCRRRHGGNRCSPPTGDPMIPAIPDRHGRRRIQTRIAYLLGTLLIAGVIPCGNDASTMLNAISTAASSPNAYFHTLPIGEPLPDGAQCAAKIAATLETIPANRPFNQTTVRPGQL